MPPPPADYAKLVQQAVQHAQLIARLTENFLSADSSAHVIEIGKELLANLQDASPVLKQVLPWWSIIRLPDSPPAAVSYFQWAYRRGQATFIHALVAADAQQGAAVKPGDWASLAISWRQAQSFARQYIPQVDLDWLDVRLLAEAQAAEPVQQPLFIHDPGVDYEVDAWEHWCDWVVATSGGSLLPEDKRTSKTWPFGLVLDENSRTVWRGSAVKRFEGNEKPWLVLMALLRRHPSWYTASQLRHDVWNPDARDCDPEDHTLHRTICDLRKYLTPLRIGVRYKKRIGYQLEDAPAATSPGATRQKPER